ncbi:hypothetical protein BDW62DRAFT_174348 [Aspergillus aurantiobrunneus]
MASLEITCRIMFHHSISKLALILASSTTAINRTYAVDKDLSGRGFLGLPQNGLSIKTGRLSNAVGAQCRFIFENIYG